MRSIRFVCLSSVALAIGCAPELEYPTVEVAVSGAVEAIASVSVVLTPASEGSASAAHESVATTPAEDGTWTARFSSLGVGTYTLAASAQNDASLVLQLGSGEAPITVIEGAGQFGLQLGPVDCAVLDCGGLDDACHSGACDGATGRCAARAREDGYGCDDGDDCTSGDRCRGGECGGDPLDEDADGVTPVRCADNPRLGDCDDADFSVSASAPEICDGKDNDCNGQIDDGLGLGACYGGPAGTQDIGRCHAGGQVCDTATGGARCAGQALPRAEAPRDGVDNDCDGEIDEPEIGCLDCGELGGSVAPAQLPAGTHPVIVTLVPPGGAEEADLPVDDVLAHQQGVLDALTAAAGAQPDLTFVVGRRFRTLPAFSGDASIAALGWLLAEPRVAGVMKDFGVEGSLGESAALVGAPQLREAAGVEGESVAVAVIDSGVDYTHPAFGACDAPGQGEGCRVVAGWDFVDDDAEPLDPSGHGTQVAGVVAGAATEGCAAGIAPGAPIVALRVLDAAGGAQFSDVVAALDWVYEHADTHGIRVVNLSLATPETFASAALCDFDLVAAAVHRLAVRGILVVAASGGGGDAGGLSFPACASGALSVGSVYDADLEGRFEHCLARGDAGCERTCTDLDPRRGQLTCASNASVDLDLTAPGEPIVTPSRGGGCGAGAGTSLAAAHAAGAAALLWAAEPTRTRDEIAERLRRGAALGKDHRSGLVLPRLDAAAANAPLACLDDDGDGVATGLRCRREATPCAEAEGGVCATEHPGLCASGRLVCGEGGQSWCAPDATPVPELCDGLDEDCDGATDEDFDFEIPCEAHGACGGVVVACTGDGEGTECLQVGALPEACSGADDDCDGVVDEEDAMNCRPHYLDTDGDDFGDGEPRCLCGPDGQHTAERDGDCAPDDGTVFPGAMHAWEVTGPTADHPELVEGGGGVMFSGEGGLFLPRAVGDWGDNLVVNPSGETADITGWEGINWDVTTDRRRTGSYSFGGLREERLQGWQEMDLSSYAGFFADGRAEARFITWCRTDTHEDADTHFFLQDVNQDGHAGGSLWTWGVVNQRYGDDGWTKLEQAIPVPAGTDHALIYFRCDRAPGGNVNDCYWDDTELRLRLDAHQGPAALVFERTFGPPVSWGALTWEADTPAGTSVTAQARSLPNPEAALGDWSDVAHGAALTDVAGVTDGHRTLQVRLSLDSDGLNTPMLTGFSVGWTADAVNCGVAPAPDPE